ncbi:MAG: acylphosphatase [Bacteroidetes bacterium]|nr:acylphosphatase [Bacteroidota bacterium]
MKHYNITVSGKVQGVFYRQSTFDIAQQLGIKGLVQNETNGSVYIEAEGTVEQLKKFVEWCKKGPARAVVSDIKVLQAMLDDHT